MYNIEYYKLCMNCIHEYERPMICDNLIIISFLKDTLALKVFEYPKSSDLKNDNF